MTGQSADHYPSVRFLCHLGGGELVSMESIRSAILSRKVKQ
jgi:hypothetical protein